ncbi:helix-turn-helix domain-containing protein [uncultured Arcticibacterium sp.]|uniref:AraC family transcriptional regulator n=1 Tax=uncultured Arcticibacterium sp. TaxID=2173042 RepID=UPI0030FC539E
MGLGSQVLFFFSALGAFNGLLLGIYFLFFSSKKYLSNYLLGALLIVLSIRIGKSVAFFFNYDLPKIYLQLGLTACFFIGPFLFFYIKSEIGKIKKMPKFWNVQLASWFILILAIGLIYPYHNFPYYWGNYIIPAIYVQWGIYVGFGGLSLINILKKKGKWEPYEKSILSIWLAVTVLYAAYVWAIVGRTRGSYILGAICFSILLYGILFVLLYRKKTSDLSSFAPKKYSDKKLNPEDASLLISKLKMLMEERHLFKNPNLKVNDLAKELNISSHQLSQFLNDNLGKNFTLFVNEYRINEACKALSKKSKLTIEAIGEDVGFNSKSTFFSTFKKLKNLTPSAYQQAKSTDL